MSGKVYKLPPRNVIELREEDVIFETERPHMQRPGMIDPADVRCWWWFFVGGCFGLAVAQFITWVTL